MCLDAAVIQKSSTKVALFRGGNWIASRCARVLDSSSRLELTSSATVSRSFMWQVRGLAESWKSHYSSLFYKNITVKIFCDFLSRCRLSLLAVQLSSFSILFLKVLSTWFKFLVSNQSEKKYENMDDFYRLLSSVNKWLLERYYTEWLCDAVYQGNI